jgi:hypothetical protein
MVNFGGFAINLPETVDHRFAVGLLAVKAVRALDWAEASIRPFLFGEQVAELFLRQVEFACWSGGVIPGNLAILRVYTKWSEQRDSEYDSGKADKGRGLLQHD